jgi:hypothetical protein
MREWNRRGFMMAAGVTASACGTAACMSAGAMNIALMRSSRIIVADRRFAASRAFALRTAKPGGRIVWITGDVTDFWYDELDLLWRREKVSLTGLTTNAPFFYLQQLAMDRGLRVTFRSEFSRVESRPAHRLIAWAISPKPSRRDMA